MSGGRKPDVLQEEKPHTGRATEEGRSGLVRGLVKVDTGVDSTSPSKSGLGRASTVWQP